MTYGKPEVALLGSATEVIEGVKQQGGTDSGLSTPRNKIQPAYDLDE